MEDIAITASTHGFVQYGGQARKLCDLGVDVMKTFGGDQLDLGAGLAAGTT